jgi:tetratricopeptide (TPR) repeat protein
MNKNQKRILIAVVVVVVAMFIYPPFQAVRNGTVYNMGYGWIFALSNRGYMTINISMLIIQWIGVFIVGGIAFFLAKGESSPAELLTQKNKVDTNFKSDQHDLSDKRTRLPLKKVGLWWNWKSFTLALVITVFLVLIIAGITGTKPPKNMFWTWLWIYLTLEAWKYWKWKALLPFPLYFFVLTIGFIFLKSAGVEYHSVPAAILIIVSNFGGLAIFYMLLNRARSSKTPATSVDEDAEIENIIRAAELKSAQGVPPNTTSKADVKQQNEEFIALLKSAVMENGLNTIHGDDLIEIYKRAKSTAGSSNEQDMELSDAINMLSEEITKRGLSNDITKPQEKESQDNSDYNDFSSQQNKADGIFKWNWGFVIIGLIIVIAITIVLFGLKSNYQNQESQDTEAVAKTQEATQELTAEGAGAYNQNIYNLSAAEWFERGYGLSTSGNHTEAVKAYSKAIALNPQLAAAYYNRGAVYRKLGNYQQAIKDYNKAIELNPLDAAAYNRRGNAYAEIGNSQQAIKDYNKAIELNPQDAAAYYNRGIVYGKLGDTNQAIENHKIAARLGHQGAQDFLRSEGIEW